MMRLIAVLALVAFPAPTTGVGSLFASDACADCCADSCAGTGGSAQPCDTPFTVCACCPSLRSIEYMPIDVTAPDAAAATIVLPGIDTHSAPDPRDILHV